MQHLKKNQLTANPFDVIKLVNRIHGLIHTQLISAVARLGIADLLSDGEKSVAELAKATGTIEKRLYRILRALTGIGIFTESSSQHFELTELAEPLRKDSPNSVRNLAIMMGSEWHARAWANILHCLENRESAFEGVYGASLFNYLQGHPDDAAVFHNTMTATAQKQAAAVCHAYNFPDVGTIVDIGGGHGNLLSQILLAHPNLRGILFDSPSVAKDAARLIESKGLTDRCQVVGGDFYDGVPKGGDVYLLKRIIHDYDDDKALTILRHCCDVMTENDRILVIDIVFTGEDLPSLNNLMDLEMMVLLNGKERTEAEFKELFSRAGLKLQRIIPTRSEVSIVEGSI